MREFFKRKGIEPTFQNYVVNTLSYMALGLFSSLIIGLIMETIGSQLEGVVPGASLLVQMGQTAMSLSGPAIGVAVAYGLGAPRLVLFAAVVSGAAGGEMAGPVGSFLAALISTEIGKMVSQETKIDIIVTPLVTIITGVGSAMLIGPPIASIVSQFGQFIMWATEQQPFLMGVLVAVFMGLALTAPISSAAIAIMLGLEGIAAGAATVGCASQMIGFAVSSFRENRWSGLLALGIGTSMLQIANIVKNPAILIPPTVTAAIVGPLSTMVFYMENNQAGAGMGTSGFVGQIMTIHTMGSGMSVILSIILLHFLLPAILSFVLSEWLRKKNIIKLGDMAIERS
ncbi:PTS sugar transporter subunit IIC [Salipaludibacillus keqinensis]|uniref:PTS sugar transporter subunit IIC n=1 Tax=Salipaludibacillus keqinensis TaxID=2045207 RepID=A0A323TMB0_9BACI|nr:PTS sugar transporter subunit IIC [Salipaludibacillus keqinensis]PYZ93793.1 PTS sugar transporter subunit IIC [Salipaludibacillus keqinensis]